MTDPIPSKELTEAVAIANRLLDEPFADPDDDARTVARQFLRGREAIERQQAQIATLKGYIERTALAGYRCAECAARLTAEPRVPGCIHDSAPTTLCQVCYPSPELGISSDRAYELGWRSAAEWAGRDDLIADIGSPVYEQDRAKAFGAAQPPGAGQ